MAEPHEPATVDAFARGFLAVVFAMFSALGGWLWARVNRNHDARIKHGERLDKLDSRVEETRAQVRDAVRDLADKAVTPECVREVIDEALDRRDRVHDTRRAELERVRQLEVRAEVAAAIDAAVPKIAREVRFSLGALWCDHDHDEGKKGGG